MYVCFIVENVSVRSASRTNTTTGGYTIRSYKLQLKLIEVYCIVHPFMTLSIQFYMHDSYVDTV